MILHLVITGSLHLSIHQIIRLCQQRQYRLALDGERRLSKAFQDGFVDPGSIGVHGEVV